MTKQQMILQGTDGIRGRVQVTDDLAGLSPLDYYLQKGFLTPAFYELYTYSYAQLMLESGNMNKGDTIIIGWDPRDKTGKFNQSAIDGLLKSGLNVIQVGILPTPAIPLYMLKQNGAGSVVLTASHNPADQNGIKLFHGYSGMKFLPDDDLRLTQAIYRYHQEKLGNKECVGKLYDHTQEARQFFIDFSASPENAWLTNMDLSQTVLVVDGSKGAVATIATPVLDQFSFKKVFYTNMEGDINLNCGVADIEGREIIKAEEVLNKDTKFYTYETLRTLFEVAQSDADIQSGKVNLTGMVFDGDGDRCFRLDYQPEKNQLLVSSGDFLGVHQALYLKEKEQNHQNQWFVNTVESDLNTAVYAESQGYKAVLTGVGDKWILLKAVLDQILAETDPKTSIGKELIQWVEKNQNDTSLSGITLSKKWKEACQSGAVKNGEEKYKFSVGFEESGHCITPGFIKTNSGNRRSFAGNGLKTALNSLAALNSGRSTFDSTFFERIENPFEQGVKETFYTYYVEKSRLLPGDSKRKEIENRLQEILIQMLPSNLSCNEVKFPEEASMVYFQIMEGTHMQGAVFIRNSGTEDKSALYLRGAEKIRSELEKIGETMHLSLLNQLKNKENEFAICEQHLLEQIQVNTLSDIETLKKTYDGLPVERILNEIELKEKLIARNKGGWKLTRKGEAYLSNGTQKEIK